MKHQAHIFAACYAIGAASLCASNPVNACALSATFSSSSPEISYDPFVAATQRSPQFTVSLTVPNTPAGQPRIRSIDYQFLDTNSPTQPRIGSDGALVEITRGSRSLLLARSVADFSNADSYNSVNVPNGTTLVTSTVGFYGADGRQDLVAGYQSENYDLVYRCNYSDGSTVLGSLPTALKGGVNTQFLVRATVVGGGSSKTLDIDPGTRAASGGMAVRSTGPYSISIASQNGLNLLPVGSPQNAVLPADQTIPYLFRVDGDSMTSTSSPKRCLRSGLSGAVLPVNTRFASGVDTNALRAGSYSDVITVTITPDVSGGGGATACGT